MTQPSPYSFAQAWDTIYISGAPWGGPAGMGCGIEIDGGAGGDVFQGQIEDFPGGRVAQWREQHDVALVE